MNFTRRFGRSDDKQTKLQELPSSDKSSTVCASGLDDLWGMPDGYREVELMLSTEQSEDGYAIVKDIGHHPGLSASGDHYPALLVDYGSGVEYEIFDLKLDDIIRQCFEEAGDPPRMWVTMEVVA